MQRSMSSEAFNVPVCPTVRSANSSMLIAAFESRSITKKLGLKPRHFMTTFSWQFEMPCHDGSGKAIKRLEAKVGYSPSTMLS